MVKGIRSTDDKIFDFVNIFLLSLLLIIIGYPIIFIISASFSDTHEIFFGNVRLLPRGFTVESYRRVLGDATIMRGYLNTILYTTAGTLLNVVMTILAAFPLSRKNFGGRNAFMIMIVITMFFSGGLIPFYMVVRSLNLLDTFWVMILPGAVGAFNIIIMRTYFQTSIPDDLTESAHIDGCSNFKALILIVLPLSKPIIAVIALFYAVGHWNSFFNALIFIQSPERFPLQLILRRLLLANVLTPDMAADAGSLAEAERLAETIKYAVIVVSSLPVIAVYPFIQKYFVKGVMIGALKG